VGTAAAAVIRTVVFPEVYAHARREGGRAAASAHLAETVLPTAVLLPPLLGLVGLAAGPVVAAVTPEFAGTLPVMRLFIFTGVGTGFVTLGTLSFVAQEKQQALPWLTFAGLVLNAALAVFALQAGFGLGGVALGALISRSITGAAVVAVSVPSAGLRQSASLFAALLWPLVWSATAVWLIGLWRPGSDLVSTAAALGVYALALLPLLPTAFTAVRRATAR
jgi:hypothetical protein